MFRLLIVSVAAIMSAFALTPAIAEAQPGSATLPAELASALDSYNRSTIAKDTTSLAELVTDDYMLVNSDGSVQGKSSYLADFKMPGFDIEPYRLENPLYRVQIDSALTSGTMHLKWSQDGQRHARRLRITHFWMHENGKWQIAFTQLTRLPDEPSQ
jgi:ketosteroid isomerase-like protein